jgi:hypothetical protein
MTEQPSLIIDILNIVPNNSICYINAPSINDDSAVLKILLPSDDNYDWHLTLTADNKHFFINIIIAESIQHEFHRLDIKYDNSLLCESYDGMCTVILSENLNIPKWFADKYVQDGLCWSMR